MPTQARHVTLVVTLLSALILTAMQARAGQVSLAWDAPTTNTDGTPLTDLAGYTLYYWQDDWDMSESMDVGKQTRYTIPALTAGETYSFAVTAYNSSGNESSFSHTFTTMATPTPDLPLEIGEVAVAPTWSRVTFSTPFVDPVVVAKPASDQDSDPVVIRIRHVDTTGFDIRLQEWGDQDGRHAGETVSYMVMEQGHYTLPDGTQVEAGHWATDRTSAFAAVSFSQPFQVVPVLLTAVTSFNGGDAVVTRNRHLSPTGFAVRMQEQERNAQRHTTETIAYIAWEPSAGTLDGFTFEVNTTPDMVTNQVYSIMFQVPFLRLPVFLADMQTTDGGNTANLRWANKDAFGVDIRIAEEQSKDTETWHTTEVVGYVVIR
jgi:hypothetical protein